MTGALLIYGANGYTGELTARFAAERKQQAIVAGRSAERIRAVADRYGFEHRVLGLDDPEALVAGLAGVGVVLHCAGPFSHTSKPMIDACLAARAHYLDITGEISVFESAAARDADARSAGVMLLPGTGFDVVPSDCLALHVARKLPDAHELTLGFFGLGSVSHGTATTMVENVHRGGFVRRDGKLTPVPTGSLVRDIDYGDGSGKKRSMAIPWGDVSTAFHSTGIPNIEVYVPATSAMIWGARIGSRFGAVLGSNRVQGFLKRRIDARPAGPTDEQRKRGKSFLVAEARNPAGRSAKAWLQTPEGYTLTALTSLEIAKRALAGEVEKGFSTPAKLLGPDFILGFEAVRRRDDDVA
jgi:short subunit dehydrogenase-like uncharacterized protein